MSVPNNQYLLINIPLVCHVLIGLFLTGAPVVRSATTYYVATNGTGDGLSWATATNSIQGAIDAIDSSNPTNTVWVSNGVYETGGRTNCPSGTVLTNRIVIDKAITVRSANNDPANTVIKGVWHPVTTNGVAAVRCVFVSNGSALVGFMLTNGATLATGAENDLYGGGVWSSGTISNCVIAGNSAKSGGGANYGTLYNCTLEGNSVFNDGGGAHYATLYNCTLINNTAASGGGAYAGTLSNCTLSGNSASGVGGGMAYSTLYNCLLTSNNCIPNVGGAAYQGTLYNCTLINNTAVYGGGANAGTLYNSTLINNFASGYGGGAALCTMYNCLLVSNSSPAGGGTRFGTLYNCTIVSNSATSSGGGVYDGTFVNCIVYFNTAPSGSNWDAAVIFTNSCTTPLPTGVGNITNDPLFVAKDAGNYRLSGNSPCINRGTNFSWMTDPADPRSKDLDARARIRYGTVDMGVYETIYDGTIYRCY